MNQKQNPLPSGNMRKVKRAAVALLLVTPLAMIAMEMLHHLYFPDQVIVDEFCCQPGKNLFAHLWGIAGFVYIWLALITALSALPFVMFLRLMKALKLKLGSAALRTKVLAAALGGTAIVCAALQSPWIIPPAPKPGAVHDNIMTLDDPPFFDGGGPANIQPQSPGPRPPDLSQPSA